MKNNFFPRVGSMWHSNMEPLINAYKYIRRDPDGNLVFWGFDIATGKRDTSPKNAEYVMSWTTFITSLHPAIEITTQVYVDGKPFEAPLKH